MTLSLRYRIVLALLPLLALLLGLGGSALALLYRLGGHTNAILRENYDSVRYMERLNEALERIDSSFGFALAGEDKARPQYEQNWEAYRHWLAGEQGNITEPGERELVKQLTDLTEQYRRQGDAFYARAEQDPARHQDYFGPGGLLERFQEIKGVSGQILHLNQESMERASKAARATARDSILGIGAGLAVIVVLAIGLAWLTTQTILRPVRAVTQSALAIGRGNLDQVVPVTSRDELGELAEAFNIMARQLRHYRQTDYARLLRAQRTSQASIDSFPDPILVVDPEGRVEMANPAAQRLLGVTPSPQPLSPEGRGATTTPLSPEGSKNSPLAPAGRGATTAPLSPLGRGVGGEGSPPPWSPPDLLRQPLREALREQRPYLPEEFDHVVSLRVNGQDQSFLPRVLPIRDPYGGTLGAAVLLQDVTRFRLLDQVKSDLVATASHELKTPLTSIRLALHLLLEEAVGPLTPKQMELLVDARDNAERLLAMVNNLLDLARLERGREHLDLHPVAPRGLLEMAADTLRPRATDKGVKVVVDVPSDLPAVAADAPRLGHALGNLLNNALTYTDRGGQITLSALESGNRVILSVVDTGHGIPPEHLPHVFEKFFRIPGQSLEGGTGLGLAIVREIVTAHGGTITCESQPGSGTVFRLTLPVWSGVGNSASDGRQQAGLAASSP